MDAERRVQMLVAAYSEYSSTVSQFYDEAVRDVVTRVERASCLSKIDIAALVSWKRLRADTPWMQRLMSTPDDHVRKITGEAVRFALDEEHDVPTSAAKARSTLTALDGLGTGDAVASTICYAAAPRRLAVYDRRAHHGLSLIGLELTHRPGRYGRYMRLIEDCRDELAQSGRAWTARQIDLALFILGR